MIQNIYYKLCNEFALFYSWLRDVATSKKHLTRRNAFYLIILMIIILIVMIILVRYRGIFQTDFFLSRDLQAEGDTQSRKKFIYLFLYAVSLFGKPIISAVVVLAAASMFFFYKYYRESVFILLSPICALTNWIVKYFVNRPRPSADLIAILAEEKGYSFPSGHVTFYTTFFGLLFTLLFFTPNIPKYLRYSLQIICIFLIISISFSRIYLGVHWLSDTIGGYLLGSIVLLVFWLAYSRKINQKT